MKKIPCNVQSLINASNQINNHNGAVKELVYNALDADATSIAIRINIQENTIQVIDNGFGVSSTDFNFIGQKYMTSKYINHSRLKSAPSTYGFRGQALSNIINVSKSVKIISRPENSEETWMKLFENGKEKLINKCTMRPSKGTTLEITGLLYNLRIQKQSKDILGELQCIKTFLEHLSLIHCNISMSLRDNSRNEIIFKIHKNRNIYQTICTLYGVEKTNLQELQVEKNEYKVTAYLGKSEGTQRHLIFLNGRFIMNSSKLHKIINNNLSNCSKLRGLQKSKMKNLNTEEESNWILKNIPDYFIFLKCPYLDYDLNDFPKHSRLEFKDWDQINKLLEKMTRFFYGDMNIKEGLKIGNTEACKAKYSDTREEVKKIMEKIMGPHSKKQEISHMHNAIKGKQAKRKIKKLSLKPTANGTDRKKNANKPNTKINNMDQYNHSDKVKEDNGNKNTSVWNYSKANKINLEKIGSKRTNSQFRKISKNNYELNIPSKKIIDKKICKKKKSRIDKDIILKKFEMETASVRKRCDKLEQRTKLLMDQMQKDAFDMFAKENITMKNNIPKKHINISVRKQIDEIIIHNNTAKSTIHDNNAGNQNVDNIMVQSNYDLLKTIIKTREENNEQRQNNNITRESNKTPAIISLPRVDRVTKGFDKTSKAKNIEPENSNVEPIITFKSHNYYINQNYVTENNSFHPHTHFQNKDQNDLDYKPRTFISKQSRDNFVLPKNVLFKGKHFKKQKSQTRLAVQFRSQINNLFKQTSKLFDLKKQIMGNACESSYTIEFSESTSCRFTNNKNVMITDVSGNTRMTIDEALHSDNHANDNNSYIKLNTSTNVLPNVGNNENRINCDKKRALLSTYTIERTNQSMNSIDFNNQTNSVTDNSKNIKNFIFLSKSQEHAQNEEIVDPIDVCQTIIQSEEMSGKEFGLSFNTVQNNLSCNNNPPTNLERNHDGPLFGIINKDNADFTQDPNIQKTNALDKINDVSHHFTPSNSISVKVNNANTTMNQCPILISKQNMESGKQLGQENSRKITDNSCKITGESHLDGFNIINRLCFLPKGMSPIFQNCQTKNVCDYNLSRDYYEKEMYNNFADGVRNNAEIFEPSVQNAKEITTKSINKVHAKLNRDSSELKFDGLCLKNAKMLGQIDEKFIAATMKENKATSANYLILFDQHAVHERIRLENYLTDYFHENRWQEIDIDAVSLILSKDDVLYLHNYKDKFEQLGLRWTVTTAIEVYIRAIPKAILGKNPRQVEKVIKAVKNLITEEINIIKVQGGCFSLYPKSIMNLVFSEIPNTAAVACATEPRLQVWLACLNKSNVPAMYDVGNQHQNHSRLRIQAAAHVCATSIRNLHPQAAAEACRYAIKFGDKLSKSECVELLKALASCKTPFQCAHGRPVMAVIMETKLNTHHYNINLEKIMAWRRKL